MLAFYHVMFSAPVNHIQFCAMQICVQLLSWLDGKVSTLLKITQHVFEYHIQVIYLCATRSAILTLPKAFIHLFHMQVHIPYIQARCDVPFQIRFFNFSGVLPHCQTTCSKVTACNLKDCKPNVQSRQSVDSMG